jgi:acetyl-CoA carboxylase carboxyl transferase subunit beta
MGARDRLNALMQKAAMNWGQEVLPVDALKFKDSRKYPERLKDALERIGETDELIVMAARCTAWAWSWPA